MPDLPNAQEIDIIFCDVDGTLLDSNHKLHPRTAKAIRSLSIPFVISSGKQYRSCLELRRELNLADHVVSAHCNGGLIQRGPLGNEVLRSRGLPHEAVLAVAALVSSRACFVFGADSLHLISADASAADWLAFASKYDQGAIDASSPPDAQRILKQIRDGELNVLKMTVCASRAEVPALLDQLSTLQGQFSLSFTRAIPEIVEIMPGGTDKGSAIQPICDAYHTTPARALAFGDGDNDVSMMQVLAAAGGHPVGMANGMPTLLASVKYQTLSNDQGGVGAFLERVFDLDH